MDQEAMSSALLRRFGERRAGSADAILWNLPASGPVKRLADPSAAGELAAIEFAATETGP